MRSQCVKAEFRGCAFMILWKNILIIIVNDFFNNLIFSWTRGSEWGPKGRSLSDYFRELLTLVNKICFSDVTGPRKQLWQSKNTVNWFCLQSNGWLFENPLYFPHFVPSSFITPQIDNFLPSYLNLMQSTHRWHAIPLNADSMSCLWDVVEFFFPRIMKLHKG